MMPTNPGAAMLLNLVIGAACGLGPMLVGQQLRRLGEGFAGLFICGVAGFFGGMFLAAPLSIMIALGLLILGPAEERRSTEFDHAGFDERVQDLRALANAKQERLQTPAPASEPTEAIQKLQRPPASDIQSAR